MTSLAAADYFTNPARTNSEAKTAHNDTLEVIREQPGGAAEQALTIASGAITPAAQASRAIKLAGEGAADDILDNVALTNVPTGALVILRGNGTDEITLNHGAGSSGQMLLRDAVDYVLDTDAKRVAFMVVGTDLLEVWRSHEAVFESAGLTLASDTTTDYNHGLGGEPDVIEQILECTTAELNYSIGDRVRYRPRPIVQASNNVLDVWADATQIHVITAATISNPAVLNKTTRAATDITLANWDYKVRAWRV